MHGSFVTKRLPVPRGMIPWGLASHLLFRATVLRVPVCGQRKLGCPPVLTVSQPANRLKVLPWYGAIRACEFSLRSLLLSISGLFGIPFRWQAFLSTSAGRALLFWYSQWVLRSREMTVPSVQGVSFTTFP